MGPVVAWVLAARQKDRDTTVMQRVPGKVGWCPIAAIALSQPRDLDGWETVIRSPVLVGGEVQKNDHSFWTCPWVHAVFLGFNLQT